MANDRDVDAAFDNRTKNGRSRVEAIEMYCGIGSLWSVQTIAGILHLDKENNVHHDDDFILIEWGFAGQMLWSDQLTILDKDVYQLWNRLDDPHRRAKSTPEEFESLIQLPFRVAFAKLPEIPRNIRGVDIHIAFMTQRDANTWPTNQFRISSMSKNGEVIVITPPDYRRKVR